MRRVEVELLVTKGRIYKGEKPEDVEINHVVLTTSGELLEWNICSV
jgi:hypothetical protein